MPTGGGETGGRICRPDPRVPPEKLYDVTGVCLGCQGQENQGG